MSQPPVVLLGAGKMGAALVDRWVDAGRAVVVWNRTAATAQALAGPQVRAEADLAAAVAGAPVVVTMLTDGDALRSVLLDRGALAALAPGSTVVDLSTVDVGASEAVAAAAAQRGVRYVRGAVSGTPQVVRSGNATLLLSAPAEAIDAATPVLAEVAANRLVVGDAEQARVVKLATNMLLAGTMLVLAEAVVLAEASGVDRAVLLDALDSTVISSRFLSYKGAALRKRDYAPTFTTADLRKDIRLASAQGSTTGVPMSVTDTVLAQLGRACDSGWSGTDFLSVVRLVQAGAGRPVDGDGGAA